MLARRQSRQRAVIAAIIAASIAFGSLLVFGDVFGPNLQDAVYDFAITQYPAAVRNQVAIVGVDDRTIARYGRYPLPRQAYVDLLRVLKLTRARVVAFDIGFYDESTDPAADRALAAAIKDAGNVVLAMQGSGSFVAADGAERFDALSLPIPLFRDAAAALGSVNVDPDTDGRVRAAQLVIEGPKGDRYYALPLVAATRSLLAAQQLSGDLSAITRQGDRLVVPGRRPLPDRVMPIDRGGGMPVYFVSHPTADLSERSGPPCAKADEFCVVSLADVVDGKVPVTLFNERTVLVGFHSASAIPDNYPTPNSGGTKMWGVEIWANTIQSIFTNRYPVRHQGPATTIVILGAASLAGALLVARFRLFGFLGSLGLLAVYMVVAMFLFGLQTQGPVGDGPVEVPSIAYVLPAVFWWVVTLGYILIEEQIALARTQSTFGRFVTPAVARTIMEREETGRLALGGEEKRVTVLFGDVRGFTSLSEGMDPARLLDTLNRYFDGMVDVVNRYGGTVNKYNGDNIMVIWGAPIEGPDQARQAVLCALELQRFIVAERATGGPDVSFGFGINTGTVVAGFLGAKGRMEYTVIGDTANVASRLTSADIARRDQVAVSAATLAELGDDVATVSLGAIAVKGRAEPVACFQVDRLGPIASPNPAPPPERQVAAAAVAGFH